MYEANSNDYLSESIVTTNISHYPFSDTLDLISYIQFSNIMINTRLYILDLLSVFDAEMNTHF